MSDESAPHSAENRAPSEGDAPRDMEQVAFVVVGVTLSNGARWYESATCGVGATRDAAKARVWPDRAKAERWAAMNNRIEESGRGGRRFHVEARSVVNGRVKVEP